LPGQVLCTTLEAASLPQGSFDVVTAWDVLEHVPHPLRFMRLAADLLKQGGFLFVNVPDLDSFASRLLGPRWPALLPEHLSYFNQKSLKLCGERAGLQSLQFGRRNASFSVDYVLHRLGQHQVPGAAAARRLAHFLRLGEVQIPVAAGEKWCAYRKL
jgi:hypothetical protein